MVWVVTFGLWNVREPPADVRRAQLVARVNQTIRGDYKIAMLSMKGGVGKPPPPWGWVRRSRRCVSIMWWLRERTPIRERWVPGYRRRPQ